MLERFYDYNETGFDPKIFTSDRQRDLFDYWLKIKKNNIMPSRKDLNPSDIAHVLSSIWMADVVRGKKIQFNVRLMGTDIVSAFDTEGTHFSLDKYSFTTDIIKRLTRLVEVKKPYYYIGAFPKDSEVYQYYSSLTLPLSTDNENVDIVVSSVHCYS